MQLLQFASLAGIPNLRHALTTRDSGTSEGEYSALNLAFHVGDDLLTVQKNRHILAETLNYKADTLVAAQQVHSAHIRLITGENAGQGAMQWGNAIPATDALITSEPNIPLLILVADCAPILLVDPEHHALAVVHAGWRGALAKIASQTVQEMQKSFGTNPAALKAGIGPCLSIENLEIGPEVGEQIAAVDPHAIITGWVKPHLDLRGLIQRDLQSVGVSEQNIETMPFCTFDDERFFSHRRQKGTAGRFGIVAWWEK